MDDNKENMMPAVLQAPSQTPETLIALGIEKGLSPEGMTQLMAMRRELKAEHAQEAFTADMTSFQAKCPVITKDKGVMNKDKTSIRYKYAPYELIVEVTRLLREQFGFSHSFDTEVVNGEVKVWCIVKHRLGHSERSSFTAPIDPESYMNKPQKSASAMTYAKRYAFVNAFGITLGDEDTDANDAPNAKTKPTKEQQDEIQRLAKEANLTAAELTQGIRKHFNTSITTLTKVQADGVIVMLKKRIADGPAN